MNMQTNIHSTQTHLLLAWRGTLQIQLCSLFTVPSDDIMPWQRHHSYRCCLQNLVLVSYCQRAAPPHNKRHIARGTPLPRWGKMNKSSNRITMYSNDLTTYKWLHITILQPNIFLAKLKTDRVEPQLFFPWNFLTQCACSSLFFACSEQNMIVNPVNPNVCSNCVTIRKHRHSKGCVIEM